MVYEKVKKILSDQFDTDYERITGDTVIADELDADSIDLIDLAMTLEDEFHMEVPDEALEKFVTVDDIVSFLDENNH